ncbi:phage major capsid family protein [Gordonia paraffinivorans]|uniref:phage major capsid family protein n=1 Tax=Gordonia paraffinivorans TaxID=175628 RepID=UPI00034B4B11|nr:phage major capsid protein [Gordonia paraffinivorans]
MDGAINPSATESNRVVVYGDWSQYVIADRIGTTVEIVPHLVGGNGRPTGQRGLWVWGRVGADSVNDSAFRVLNVATTA